MKTKYIIASVAFATALAIAMIPNTVEYNPTTVVEASTPERKLTHAQEVWLGALEWCESNGNIAAINPDDLDHTPSWGAFQFKPSTLDYYAAKYGVATTTLMDYKTQRAVVEQMVLHRDEIKWTQQFPWCVKKLGLPPKP